jgi:hypothetical protein
MDQLLDVLLVAGALASSGAEQASLDFVLDGLQRVSGGLVAEGHAALVLELHHLLVECGPPEVLNE